MRAIILVVSDKEKDTSHLLPAMTRDAIYPMCAHLGSMWRQAHGVLSATASIVASLIALPRIKEFSWRFSSGSSTQILPDLLSLTPEAHRYLDPEDGMIVSMDQNHGESRPAGMHRARLTLIFVIKATLT